MKDVLVRSRKTAAKVLDLLLLRTDEAAELAEQKAHPDVKKAKDFNGSFEPTDKDSTAWILELAKARFAFRERSYKELDDKAAAITGYLGSGTGIFTLGSLAAIASDKVNPYVVIAAFPSVFFAAWSLWWAIRCRMAMFIALPNVETAVTYLSVAKFPEVEFAGQWEWAAAMTVPALDKKARYLNNSLRCFFWSIVAIALPMIAGIIVVLVSKPPAKVPASFVIPL